MQGQTSFIVVICHKGVQVTKTEMFRCQHEDEVLKKIGDFTPEASLDRVFQIDEFGNIAYYHVVFNGRLKLECMPMSAPDGQANYLYPAMRRDKFRNWVDMMIDKSTVSMSEKALLNDIRKKIDSGDFDV